MSVIDDYLKDLPEPRKEALERIRSIVNATVSDAEEVITYAMPGFKYKGKYLIAFSNFKDHMSLFPGALPEVSSKAALAPFQTSKGTLQFTADNPIPEKLIVELLEIRMNAINA